MRFYTQQHPFDCGLDLHARSMDVCIVHHAGAILLHRNMQAAPDPFLTAIAPYREGLVVAVARLFTWYWLADLCAPEGMAFVLGHALSIKAMHGGTATNDTSDSHKLAVLLRGGLLPHASVSPAPRRAPRDLLRRRTHLRRPRAALLAQVHNTHRPDNRPEIGTKSAYQANREGVAAHFADPAGPKTLAGDLALSTSDDALLTALELSLLPTAKHHAAPTLSLVPTVPGIGQLLRLGLLYALHAIDRCASVHACVSSCRLGTGAKASAGKRLGMSGQTIGHVHRTWAFAEAAPLFLRTNPAGHIALAR